MVSPPARGMLFIVCTIPWTPGEKVRSASFKIAVKRLRIVPGSNTPEAHDYATGIGLKVVKNFQQKLKEGIPFLALKPFSYKYISLCTLYMCLIPDDHSLTNEIVPEI